MYFSFRETTLQFVSPFWAHQMSRTEFVYFWKVLEPCGTFWKNQYLWAIYAKVKKYFESFATHSFTNYMVGEHIVAFTKISLIMYFKESLPVCLPPKNITDLMILIT